MKNTIKARRGFTLIELLVVIAIIGILSAVVLASLLAARQKGNDAAVKANLNNARGQAELFNSDNNGHYVITPGSTDDVCAPGATAGGSKGIYEFALAASKASSVALTTNLTDNLGTTGKAGCHACPANGACAPKDAWAIEVPLSGTYPGITKAAYCVQSDGFSGVTDISAGSKLSSGDAKCSI